MKKSCKIISFILAVMLMFTIVGCAKKPAEDPEETPTPSIQTYTENGKKYVIDSLGRTVEIPGEIKKVAAMHIYGAKMFFAMQVEDHAAFKLGIGDDFKNFAAVDADYAALPDSPAMGNGSTITESLLALDVNLVLTNANNGPEEANTYANAGIAAIAVRGETFEEVYDTARMMGFVFDKEERAEELITFIKSKLDIVNSRVKDLSEKDKPTVMICGTRGIYTAASKDMFQNEMIETAGGINASAGIEGSNWAKINAEDIISWDPDYIILSNSSTEEDLKEVLNDPALSTVTAVKNGNVIIFPSTLGWWDFPLPQSMLGIIWLATAIHPDKFEDVDMLSLANEIYEFMYGYTYEELGGEL